MTPRLIPIDAFAYTNPVDEVLMDPKPWCCQENVEHFRSMPVDYSRTETGRKKDIREKDESEYKKRKELNGTNPDETEFIREWTSWM